MINVGDSDTAQSGGEYWVNETIITAVKEFVYNGGGFIGVGEPAAHQWQGKFFQLDDVLGVEEERGFNLNTDKIQLGKNTETTLFWLMQKVMWTSVRAKRIFLRFRKPGS